MPAKKRYAQVGCGGRSGMYTKAIVEKYPDHAELVALCDINQGRMDLKNRFEEMISQTKPDTVIVTTGPDATHSDYIIRAMEAGCDVVTEKPMTTDEAKCRAILETRQRTGKHIQVTFNYRYAPHRSQVKEMLQEGVIGDVLSVDFCWPLDTRHGADYFRRWHRKRDNSGSLLVHKATHHFDLVNWWLGDSPEEVFCHGSRKFYVPATADELGLTERTERCHTCPHLPDGSCKFSLDLTESDNLRQMYLECEDEDGYFRDRCVFSGEIDIWDNMSVSVRFKSGAMMNYFLHTYCPWEGYQIAFNGSRGRLEHGSTQFGYISGEQESAAPGQVKKEGTYIIVHPMFGQTHSVEPRKGTGGHGGGDSPLLDDIFLPDPPHDPLGRRADHVDGAWSILTGVAAYHSIDRSAPVNAPDLIAGAPM